MCEGVCSCDCVCGYVCVCLCVRVAVCQLLLQAPEINPEEMGDFKHTVLTEEQLEYRTAHPEEFLEECCARHTLICFRDSLRLALFSLASSHSLTEAVCVWFSVCVAVCAALCVWLCVRLCTNCLRCSRHQLAQTALQEQCAQLEKLNVSERCRTRCSVHNLSHMLAQSQ